MYVFRTSKPRPESSYMLAPGAEPHLLRHHVDLLNRNLSRVGAVALAINDTIQIVVHRIYLEAVLPVAGKPGLPCGHLLEYDKYMIQAKNT